MVTELTEIARFQKVMMPYLTAYYVVCFYINKKYEKSCLYYLKKQHSKIKFGRKENFLIQYTIEFNFVSDSINRFLIKAICL